MKNPTAAPTRAAVGARLRRLPLPVLLGLMLVGGLCALLALNTASAAQELQQRSLTDANANTLDVEQQLERDLAAKQAPAALASAALAQGLVPNPNPAFLRINADGSVTVLGSPAPASVPPAPVTPTPPAAASPTSAATAAGTSVSPTTARATPGASATSSGTSTVPTTAPRSAAPVVTVTVTRAVGSGSGTASRTPANTAPSTDSTSIDPTSTANGGVAAPTPGGH